MTISAPWTALTLVIAKCWDSNLQGKQNCVICSEHRKLQQFLPTVPQVQLQICHYALLGCQHTCTLGSS